MSHAENCAGKAVLAGSRFAGDANWTIERCPICDGGREVAGVWSVDLVPNRKVYRGGNAWCVVGTDFINLQESPAGFGETQQEAASNYVSALALADKGVGQ